MDTYYNIPKRRFYLNELNYLLETLPDSIQEEIKGRLKDYICWMKREEPLQ